MLFRHAHTLICYLFLFLLDLFVFSFQDILEATVPATEARSLILRFSPAKLAPRGQRSELLLPLPHPGETQVGFPVGKF